jgi:hypothetical protein
MKHMSLAATLLALVVTTAAQQSSSTEATGSASAQSGQTGAQMNGAASAQTNQNGQSAGAQTNVGATGAGSSAASGPVIEAELTKGLDAKKAKQGDPVMAKCMQEVKGKGDFRIPKNAKLIGHVTEAQARGKGQAQSSLAIAFDKAQLKDGREIPLQAIIQAIAPPQSAAMEMDNSAPGNDSMGAPAASSRSSGGALGGVNSTVNSAGSEAGRTTSNVGGATASTAGNLGSQASATAGGPLNSPAGSSLNTASTGVIGLKGLQLDTAASNATQGSVIHSSSDNVRLESGTRLVLRMVSQ